MSDREQQPFVQDTLHIPEGRVSIQMPAVLTVESLREIGDFFELVLRTATRAVEKTCRPIDPQR